MSTEPPGTVKNHHHQSGGGGLEAIEEALRVLTLREFDQELSKGRIVENPKAYRAEIKRRLRRELAAVLRVSLTKDLTADQILAEVDREYVARASEALAREVEELRKRMLDKLAQRKHFHPDREALIDEILRLIPELRLHASLVDELRGAA